MRGREGGREGLRHGYTKKYREINTHKGREREIDREGQIGEGGGGRIQRRDIIGEGTKAGDGGGCQKQNQDNFKIITKLVHKTNNIFIFKGIAILSQF